MMGRRSRFGISGAILLFWVSVLPAAPESGVPGESGPAVLPSRDGGSPVSLERADVHIFPGTGNSSGWFDSDSGGTGVFVDAFLEMEFSIPETGRLNLELEGEAFLPAPEAGEGADPGAMLPAWQVLLELGNGIGFQGGRQDLTWGEVYGIGEEGSPRAFLLMPETLPEEEAGVLFTQAEFRRENVSVTLLAVFPDPGTSELSGEPGLASSLHVAGDRASVTAGAFFRSGGAPRIRTGFAGNLRDVFLYSEAGLSFGSDKNFIGEGEGGTLITWTEEDRIFPSLTLGVQFLLDGEKRRTRVSHHFQYLYNGEGYADPSFLLGSEGELEDLISAGGLFPADLAGVGRHYWRSSTRWEGIGGSDFSMGLEVRRSWSDMSGLFCPTLSWPVKDAGYLALNLQIRNGEAGEEFSPAGRSLSLGITAGIRPD